MKLIPLRKKGLNPKFALVDDLLYPILNKYNWYERIDRYGLTAARTETIRKDKKRKNYVLMQHLVMKAGKSIRVVHLDGNPLNNQRYNLALGKYKPGIYKDGRCTKRPFQVYLKRKYLGNYATEEEAETVLKAEKNKGAVM